MMNRKPDVIVLLFILFAVPCILQAQDSLSVYKHSVRFKKIITDTSGGIIRGCFLGENYEDIRDAEKALMEGEGDDFLLYRILCD